MRSIILLSIGCVAIGGWLWLQRFRITFVLSMAFVAVLVGIRFIEPLHYNVDMNKRWEYIPGYFKPEAYDLLSARWHSLGRTDIYRIKNNEVRRWLTSGKNITFQVNLPEGIEFAYFSTNFLGGTPVYRYPAMVGKKLPAEVSLFSQMIEAPYVLLKDPKVFIIGTGGGRDIFLAASHGAVEIAGAEINGETFRAMSKGGKVYEYSNRVYDLAKVRHVDGRHLVKVSPENYYDLVVLNGVDTFSGLSSGAYAYAESYLYTKEALQDYWKILNDGGIINFNRWLLYPPRETLRLEAIAFEALKSLGVKDPTAHVLILQQTSWSMTLIKKTPFNNEEIQKVVQYANDKGMRLIYPSDKDRKIIGHSFEFFDLYADSFRKNKQRAFAEAYPYDISVVTDDAPFFYKYYKFDIMDFLHPKRMRYTGPMLYNGPVVFWTQFLVLGQAVIFILLFIFLPLLLARQTNIKLIPAAIRVPFVFFFACLGVGFMFIEIPLMQKFVLLLGTPICSISVVLAALLGWTGIGSLMAGHLPRLGADNDKGIITAAALVVSLFILIFVHLNAAFFHLAIGLPFVARVLCVVAVLAPIGVFLGVFFPLGLRSIASYGPSAIAWAWALNSGFSVLGSMLAITIAQFMGFNAVLLMALMCYLCGVLVFLRIYNSSQ